jgi:hypothetical protein
MSSKLASISRHPAFRFSATFLVFMLMGSLFSSLQLFASLKAAPNVTADQASLSAIQAAIVTTNALLFAIGFEAVQ